MMMAMMLVASATAFAGDSDALKAIMKAKTYADAEQLLKSNLSQLANNEEKAKAYNKLVDLAMTKVTKESTIVTENQANAQLGIDKKKDVDMVGLCDALIDALNAAAECNKYDQQPNAKGKVAPKFAEKNSMRLWANRQYLITKGDEYRQSNEYAKALKYWEPYLDSFEEPLYAAQNHEQEKEAVEQIAYLTAWMAYNQKDFPAAEKYATVAMKGEKFKDDAQKIKYSAMAGELKTRQDSLTYVERLKAEYAKDPENETIINNLYNIYGEMKEDKAQKELLEGILAKNPNNFIALANMGVMHIGNNDYVSAIPFLRRAIGVRSDNPQVYYYLGTSLCITAQDEKTPDADKKKMYKEAIEVFDKCKELDPKKEQINWGYNRQNAYYNFYGPDSAEFKQAEADYKN